MRQVGLSLLYRYDHYICLRRPGRRNNGKAHLGPLQSRGQCGTLGASRTNSWGFWRPPYSCDLDDATMIHSELLKILVCPETQSSLSLASSELIAALNDAIARGQLKNKAGQKIEKLMGGGLVRADQRLLYPIVDEIPMMLVDEAIPLDQIGKGR
jgi:uncharacterized protein YbaR (Trm112 family)